MRDTSLLQFAAEADMIKAHDGIWKDGYIEGDPLGPYGVSEFAQLGSMSMLHAFYRGCVGPYALPGTRVVEIGTGRGAWTKSMLPAQEIGCMDAQGTESNYWSEVLLLKTSRRAQQI